MKFVKREFPPIHFYEDVDIDEVLVLVQVTSVCRDGQNRHEECLTFNDSL